MKIVKKFQGTVPDNKILDAYSTSQTDTYSCAYSNAHFQQFPIGYIYISAINTSPASLFGGTWVQLKSRYLYATGLEGGSGSACGKDNMSTYTGANTQSHTLTANQSGLRLHAHQQKGYLRFSRSSLDRNAVSFESDDDPGGSWTRNEGGWDAAEGHSHNVSYIAVYVWQKTA